MNSPRTPDGPPVGIAADESVPFATVRQFADGRVRCSDGLFTLLGFDRGEVVPTTALLAAHMHPQDRAQWVAAWARAATGVQVAFWHRIVTTRDRVLSVLTTLTPDNLGSDATWVDGVLVDLTDRVQLESSTRATEAVERAAKSRGLIEAAKGMLMVILDVDDDQAFDLLRWHSSHANVKVRDVAALLVDGLGTPVAGTTQRRQVADILAGLSPSRVAELVPHAAAPSASSVPEALLSRLLQRAVDHASMGVTVVDCERPEQPLVYVNGAFERLTGFAAADVLGQNCRFLQGPGTEAECRALIRTAVESGRETRVVIRNYRKDRTAFYNELQLSPVRNKNGRITHYIGYQQDVTERVERQDDMGRMGQQDQLTGLPNEQAAVVLADQLVAGGAAHVLSLRSDAFTADGLEAERARVLTLLAARRLRTAIGHDPLVARSGDALVVVSGRSLPDDDTLDELFGRPIVTLDGPVPIQVKLGRASYPEQRTGADLVAAARF